MRPDAETKHRPRAEPPPKDDPEMAFATALRHVVDDLFTCKAAAERLQDSEGNEPIETLVSHHKLLLVEHLEEVAWRGIDEFLAQLESLQTQPELPLPSSPAQRDDLDNRIS